ncbi:MAG: aspartate aminotransferase family protein [Candidatus Omnitrophica bacterium]|nr:aspartate aminotransferase family protein [Candidatus Omnitrophota bacterium]
MDKTRWYKLEDVERLSAEEKIRLTQEYVNCGMVKLFGLLGLDKIWASSAEGMYITLSDGRRILDMSGGNGVLGLGHNHPRILKARIKIAQEKRLEFCKAFISPYVAALAANLASLLPGDLEYSFFCNSGAEAVEGALKLAEKHHGLSRSGLVYTDQSFHGKSHAAMSVSSLDDSRKNFKLLERCYQVPYGDAGALEQLFIQHCKKGNDKPDLCAFIVEAIHGTRIIFPPAGYLRKVRELCTRYDVLLIMDEIYTGFGHTGYWFAFQAEEIIPDIVCYSKTFGGGKASIAGYTARAPVFLKAYGNTGEALMHSSTFSGMSEECATAIEALNIFKDEHLIDRAHDSGEYLKQQLRNLQKKYPERINDVRGRGLLWGVELKPPMEQVEQLVAQILPDKSPILSTLAGAIVLAELFHTHNVLAYLGFTRRNLIVFSPALIVDKKELDRAVGALDATLSLGWLSLGRSFIARKVLK